MRVTIRANNRRKALGHKSVGYFEDEDPDKTDVLGEEEAGMEVRMKTLSVKQ